MTRDNQSRSELDPAFNEIKEVLNLKKYKQGLYECQRRIIGDYPIFVPRITLLFEYAMDIRDFTRPHMQLQYANYRQTEQMEANHSK